MPITPAALAAAQSGNLENLLAAMMPGGIERQEKNGQIEQSFKETLPLKLDKPSFEAVGFVFGDPEDDLFQKATFPKGWRKKPTEHSMWTDIVDETGKKLGSIFYKAAFYDRDAFASLDNPTD